MLRSATGYLNQQIANLVAETNGQYNNVSFHWLDVSQIYENDSGRHGLCTGEPWINGITVGITGTDPGLNPIRYQRSFHPNQKGHDATGTATANLIQQLDWTDLQRPVANQTVECIDAPTAVALAAPLFSGVTDAEFISCQGTIAVASLFWPDGTGVTTAYVFDDGQWQFIDGSFGLRSVCETVWSIDPSTDIGCGVNFTWPYSDYFSVPQLGIEAVRGSGCGGSGEIGDSLPDGLWSGYVLGLTDDAIDFDLACVYFGDSAVPFVDEYLRTTPEDEQLDYNADYWVVTNTVKGRSVPLADEFVYRTAEWRDGTGCVDPGPTADVYAPTPTSVIDSWLRVVGGEAQWMLTSCPYG